MSSSAICCLEDLAVAGDLLQRVGQSLGITGELDGGGVGEILALAGDGELEETGEDGSEDGEHDGDDDHYELYVPTASPAPASAATEPEAAQEEVGDQDRGADQDADQHRVADVEVADVGHLVRDDALELVPVELVQEAGGHGDGGVLRVATRGEGVGGGIVDNVDLRHRKARGQRHLLDDVEEDGGVVVGDLLRARGGEHHPGAAVVGGEAGDSSHDKSQNEAEDGAYRIPDPGPPDDVAEDGDEREEARDQEQAVAPVYGDSFSKCSLVGALGHLFSRRRPSRTPARGRRPRSTPSR